MYDPVAYHKAYYQRNRERLLCRAKEYRIENLDVIEAKAKIYRKNNRATRVAWLKIYNEKNKEKLKIKDQEKYKKNRDKVIARSSAYFKNNKELVSERTKKYYLENKETIYEQVKKYRENHRDKINEYLRNKNKTNIQFHLTNNLRKRLVKAVREEYKSGSAVSDLGCSIPEFKAYIENQFVEGMSWDNWGVYGWHLDHEVPLYLFDLTKREQFLKACHYTNIQPLWAKDNLQKNKFYA